MITIFQTRNYKNIVTCFLFFVGMNLFANPVVLKNEDVIGEKTITKIEKIGKELYNKTGVHTYIVAIKSLQKKPLITYQREIVKNLQKPYTLLILVQFDHQVDIVSSKELENKIDKEQILSPYPWSGTIIPILTTKKGKDKYSAALLNGYGDIADQIANSYNIDLESSIGSVNKNFLAIIRILFYGSIIAVLLAWLYWRIKSRARKNETKY